MTNLTNGAAPLLEVQQVRKVFSGAGGMMSTQEVLALDDVSLVLQGDQAKLLTIVGESGSGKSTLARCILGLTPISGGSIRYRGQEISQMNKAELLAYRRAVQPVFQDPYSTYNPFYRIDRVLNMIVRKFKLAPSPKEASKLIDEALRAVDLRPHDVLGRYPHQLSGGERQRIMLARIYLMKPRLIIADEPISMIDAALRALFLNILLDFRDQLGISCIFITHNLATAYYLGGEIMVMCRGRSIEEGAMDSVVKEPSHPYTQLLIDSVPSQDPRNRWNSKRTTNAVEASELTFSANACVIVERCP
ncbi:MAG: ABC transporter ATP-binding protein, partial [Caldilineaceae bacterium]|nr:ABC transporter ATP-binding protein [Caldilineaceae bacterium]